jgi:hypothetical protein
MLEGIQILIDRMEMFPDDFREGGNLYDYLYILDETGYYKQILTEEEIAAYREATLKFHREALNRKIIENVMQGQRTQRENKLLREMKNFTQKSGLYGEVAVGGAGGGGTGVIGGGAFTTKTGALFTPANIPTKKKK